MSRSAGLHTSTSTSSTTGYELSTWFRSDAIIFSEEGQEEESQGVPRVDVHCTAATSTTFLDGDATTTSATSARSNVNTLLSVRHPGQRKAQGVQARLLHVSTSHR